MEMAWLILFLFLLAIGGSIWMMWQREGLRILMYHKVDPEKSDFLTVKVSELEKQILGPDFVRKVRVLHYSSPTGMSGLLA